MTHKKFSDLSLLFCDSGFCRMLLSLQHSFGSGYGGRFCYLKKKCLHYISSVNLEAFYSIYPCRLASSVEWSVDDEAQVVGYNSV
jgi:hypothetical protein